MNFTLNGRLLKYEENGDIYISYNIGIYKINPKWKKLSSYNNNCGYKVINIGGKKYLLHRIISMLFLGLNIDDTKQHIDHIDVNRQNNNLENLRIVTQQQNNWNRTKAKGYCFNKIANKFQVRIMKDGKAIYLGLFETEEEARQAYLNAKQKYHLIE